MKSGKRITHELRWDSGQLAINAISLFDLGSECNRDFSPIDLGQSIPDWPFHRAVCCHGRNILAGSWKDRSSPAHHIEP